MAILLYLQQEKSKHVYSSFIEHNLPYLPYIDNLPMWVIREKNCFLLRNK